MDAKQYLSQAYILFKEIKWKKEKVAKLRDLLSNISPSLSEVPHGEDKNAQKMEEWICSIETLEDAIANDLILLTAKKIELTECIMGIYPESYRDILYKRYIEFKKWKDICNEMQYSKRYIFQLHQKAIEKIDSNLNRNNNGF